MKVIDCKQGSTAWLQARCGIPTASEFDNLISPEWKTRAGQTPESYMLKKVAETVMGYPLQSFGGGAMEQGSLLEGEALPWYTFTTGVEVRRVGFCTTDDGRIGCSPDGLIGDDGGLEIKCPEAHTHLKYLLGGTVPKEYLAQIHGCMYVTGRPWWTFISYSRWFPPLVVRVERDEAIQQALHAVLTRFLADYDAATAKIKGLLSRQQKGGRE